MLRQLTKSNVQNLGITAFIILGTLLVGQFMHESAHFLACEYFGATSMTNFISFNQCTFQREPTENEIAIIRFVGGAFASLLAGSAYLILRLKYHATISPSLKMLQIGLLVLAVVHGSFAVLETWAYSVYAQNVDGAIGYAVYMVGLAVAIIFSGLRTKKGVKF